MKPLIGIVSRPNISIGKSDCQIMEEVYRNAIINSGGIPFMISPMQNISYNSVKPRDVSPMSEDEKSDLNRLLELCDGILIPGGRKVYEYDFYICEYAKDNNIPILGICAGMQTMARLDSDINLEKLENNNHEGLDDEYTHSVNIIKDTLLYKIIGKDKIEVNSFHSYKVNSKGSSIYIFNAFSSEDNIIEGIEYPNNRFYLGVQWHPERCFDDNNKKLFKYFINECKKTNQK